MARSKIVLIPVTNRESFFSTSITGKHSRNFQTQMNSYIFEYFTFL
jgi:hypothetical protein